MLQEQDFEDRWNRAARLLGFTPATRPENTGRVWHSMGDVDGTPCILYVGVPGELEQARAACPGRFPATLWTGPGMVLCEPGKDPGRTRASEILDLLENIGPVPEPDRVIPLSVWARGMFTNGVSVLCARAGHETQKPLFLDYTGVSRKEAGQLVLSPQPLVEAPLGLALAAWSGTGEKHGGTIEALEARAGVDVAGWARFFTELNQINKQQPSKGQE